MNIDIEQIKAANDIVEVIQETYPLRKSGNRYRAEIHDSLVVDPGRQAFFWNSKNAQGDVITWVMRQDKCDFKTAVEKLAGRAGIEMEWKHHDPARYAAARRRYDAPNRI